jgi:hypothetical protein
LAGNNAYLFSPAESDIYDFPISDAQLSGRSPGTLFKENVQLSPKGWPVTTRKRNSDGWKPPDAWKCPKTPTKDHALPESPVLTSPWARKTWERKRTAIDITAVRRNLKRMEAASPNIMLERFTEELPDMNDPSIYMDLELEKQLWMLSALHRSKPQREYEQPSSRSLGPAKILSLFENQGLFLYAELDFKY